MRESGRRAGGAGVVEVNVGEQQLTRPALAQAGDQLLHAGARAAVDQHLSCQPRAEGARAPAVAQVDGLGAQALEAVRLGPREKGQEQVLLGGGGERHGQAA